MRVDILSDLHVEFNGFMPFYDRLQKTGSEVLICAGDMGPAGMDEVRYAFRELCKYYKRVIYVPGNHDYYGYTVKMGNEYLRSLEDWLPNLEILSPGKMTNIGDKKVIGATMWVPHKSEVHAHLINDPFQIPDLFFHLNSLNSEAVKFLNETVDENTIVVTHHLPHPKSVASQYKNEPTNCWFLCDMSELIEDKKPYMWIHGHSHNKADYQVGPTRIINNAYGYPSENRVDKFGVLTYYF